MRRAILAAVFLVIGIIVIRSNLTVLSNRDAALQGPTLQGHVSHREIRDQVKRGETLFDIFKKYNLDLSDLFRMREASASVHRLRDLAVDRPYSIVIDDNARINTFEYWIDDDYILSIRQTGEGFAVEKTPVPYEKKELSIAGTIEDNLIASLEGQESGLQLALGLSDVFAWDIDFTTDLRKGDTFRVVVEGYFLDGRFRKFGDILAAEFMNNGERFRAYRFMADGKADFFDEKGTSLRKAFLKAPLSFRRISSSFSKGRRHPILKIVRPHHGIDYSAPTGTPVSASGDGRVQFAGSKGQYGRLVIVSHRNGYRTYYGHLSRIAKNLRQGARVDQGQVIGYVGSTGLATGPHLHYEMRVNDRPVNPLSQKIPRGTSVPRSSMAVYTATAKAYDAALAAITMPAKAAHTAAAQR